MTTESEFMRHTDFDATSDPKSRLKPLGRFLFVAGLTLIASRGIDFFSKMPGLPAFWYTNQSMWILIGLGMSASGWRMLWTRQSITVPSWQPSIPGKRFQALTLMVSEGCHLCEEAAAILAKYQTWIPPAIERDIHSDPILTERFSTCVPVVMLDGKIRFRGRIQEILLQRLIEGTPPIEGKSNHFGSSAADLN
jgi:hypothetical protein